MKTRAAISFVVLALGLLPATSGAQDCNYGLTGTGQPCFTNPATLLPVAPICSGSVALPVLWASGNPGFALSAVAGPEGCGPAQVPPGSPMFLLVGLFSPSLLPVGPPLDPAFGSPGILVASPILLVVPAGLAPGPGAPLSLPVPPTGGPFGMVFAAHTLVFLPGPPAFALTGAVGISI